MKTDFECKLISVLFRKDTLIIEGLLGETNGQVPQEDFTLAYQWMGDVSHVKSRPFALKDEATHQPSFSGRLFKISLPLSAVEKATCKLQLFVWWQNRTRSIDRISTCSLTAIEHTFIHSKAYFYSKGYILKRVGPSFLIQRASLWRIFKSEVRYLLHLLLASKKSRLSLVITRLKTFLLRFFKVRPIWLVADRISQADDCGEAMFRYLRANHARTLDAYFILSPTCNDYVRLKAQYGKHIVPFKSKRHKQLHLLADAHLHSQVEYNLRNPLGSKGIANSDLYGWQPVVFLQHGIALSDLSLWINKTKNLTGVILSAKEEKQSFLKNQKMGFNEEQLWLTGLARLDVLDASQSEKMITFMPTWRQNLTHGVDPITGRHRLVEDFEQSTFVQMWTKFINHPRLKEAAEHYGFCLNVRQHPIFQPYRDRFPFLPHILQRQDSLQENYARSALIVTDYSSSVYDFAYLRKPIVYFQFDRTTFFGGYHHTLGETIPKYEEVGLGEVTTEVETAVDILCDYMKNGCILKPKYRERMDAFFAFNDQHACERIYHKLQAFCME